METDEPRQGSRLRRLRSGIRESDTAARIGGDEFMVLLRDIEDDGDALTVASKIRAVVSHAFMVEGRSIKLSVSIGIALYPQDGEDIVEVSKHAGHAMYRVKACGTDAVAFFDCEIDEQ